MTTTYCARNDIGSIIGEPSILACIDDDRDGVESPAEQLYIAAAINRAAVEMNQSLCRQYTISELVNNDWCKWCNAYLASWFLYARRGNPPPPSIVDSVQTYRQQLAEIMFGRFQVPEQNPSFDHTPTVSNFKPELIKSVAPIRVNEEESTGLHPVPSRKRNPSGIPGPW
jgi:hypothetical protein